MKSIAATTKDDKRVRIVAFVATGSGTIQAIFVGEDGRIGHADPEQLKAERRTATA